MTHTAIPEDELKVFSSLKNVRTVVDAGARDDVDYLIIKPNITLHAFEPNPGFFKQLYEAVQKLPKAKVHLNMVGLGDKDNELFYNPNIQTVEGSAAWNDQPCTLKVPIRRLDDYVKEMKIKRIDFFKIDVEGFELQVLKGARNAIKMTRYLQYERHDPIVDAPIENLLKKDFTFHYTGYRNVLCVRKGEEIPWIPEEPKEGGLTEKP